MATEAWIGSFEGERVARATSKIDARLKWLRGLDRPEKRGQAGCCICTRQFLLASSALCGL